MNIWKFNINDKTLHSSPHIFLKSSYTFVHCRREKVNKSVGNNAYSFITTDLIIEALNKSQNDHKRNRIGNLILSCGILLLNGGLYTRFEDVSFFNLVQIESFTLSSFEKSFSPETYFMDASGWNSEVTTSESVDYMRQGCPVMWMTMWDYALTSCKITSHIFKRFLDRRLALSF